MREMRLNEVNSRRWPHLDTPSLFVSTTADAHCNRAKDHGARITQEPVTHPYERAAISADEFAGHRWTFSQSIVG